jgi:hypothetical protein
VKNRLKEAALVLPRSKDAPAPAANVMKVHDESLTYLARLQALKVSRGRAGYGHAAILRFMQLQPLQLCSVQQQRLRIWGWCLVVGRLVATAGYGWPVGCGSLWGVLGWRAGGSGTMRAWPARRDESRARLSPTAVPETVHQGR